MFDEYAKKIESMGAKSPKIFKRVSLEGATQAVNEAQEITDRYNKVDTGYYRRHWYGERLDTGNGEYGIVLSNGAEYASFIEEGYKLKNGGRMKGFFIGRMALDRTEGKIILRLQDELKILMLQKDYGLTRKEAKKYI